MLISSESQPHFKITYIPALDGLRALAILAVMGYHATLPGAQGGFIGVDVFFTLSGFLITALLVKEHDTQHAINLKNFYLRRVLRLVPGLYAFVAIFLLFDLSRKGMSAVEESVIVMLNITNWVRAFDLFPMLNMDHMWSLAVEEQFYLVWPFVLSWLLRLRLSINHILWIVLGISGVLLLLRASLILGGTSVDRIYNGLDTRAGSILLGCALALALRSPQFPFRSLVEFVRRFNLPLILLTVSIFGWNMIFAQRNASQTYLLIPDLIGLLTCVIILDVILFQSGFLNKFLIAPPLVGLGRISYGIYLWHFPVLGLLLYTLQFSPLMAFLVGGSASVAIASVSYRFLERPLLKLKSKYESSQLVGTAIRSESL